MICPKCGLTIEPGSKFCKNCGAVLSVTPFETVQPVQPVQQVEPVQPVQPVQVTQPVQGFNEFKPVEPTQPVQPGFQNNKPNKKKSSGGKIALIIIGIFVAFNILLLITIPLITNSLSKAIIIDSFEEKGLNGEWVSYYSGKMVIEDGNTMTLYPNYSYITEKGEDEYIKANFTGLKGQKAIDQFKELVGEKFDDELDYDLLTEDQIENLFLLTFEYTEIELEDNGYEAIEDTKFLVFYDEYDDTLTFIEFDDEIIADDFFRE